ncbi:ADP-ribosylglycohydrolase family protein [Nocardia stercoris]|uniref:ADP-ribosylglycohydrolase family protein n=1 Tax=Nocardia stercoris TaxID=2483361 RepID=A0A3M2KWU1_9NOCA|nr:ADP-ribosylglycohydrolase family protein [Nocardia stercoris]RMI29969.1 ADP-ribosylglycohydrolase family protein [Nocardia stercoris]
MKLTAAQLDRAEGVLLGTAVGDALGAGYEFTYPTTSAAIDMIGGGVFNWAPGEWTDDTSMAVAVAEGAASGGRLDREPGLDAVAAGFVQWWDSHPTDIGNQTRMVLRERSASAREMRAVAGAIPGLRAGNGSLMRTAPVALAHLDDAGACAVAAREVSRLTHDDPHAIDGCVLWSLAIRTAVLDGTYHGIRQGLAYVSNEWHVRLSEAENGLPSDFSKNGWVVHALQTAWSAIVHTDSLPDGLTTAVRAGGDTDTTAAIAGGLLGARYGASAIPMRWREIVHGYPGCREDYLIGLTHRVLATNSR